MTRACSSIGVASIREKPHPSPGLHAAQLSHGLQFVFVVHVPTGVPGQHLPDSQPTLVLSKRQHNTEKKVTLRFKLKLAIS